MADEDGKRVDEDMKLKGVGKPLLMPLGGEIDAQLKGELRKGKPSKLDKLDKLGKLDKLSKEGKLDKDKDKDKDRFADPTRRTEPLSAEYNSLIWRWRNIPLEGLSWILGKEEDIIKGDIRKRLWTLWSSMDRSIRKIVKELHNAGHVCVWDPENRTCSSKLKSTSGVPPFSSSECTTDVVYDGILNSVSYGCVPALIKIGQIRNIKKDEEKTLKTLPARRWRTQWTTVRKPLGKLRLRYMFEYERRRHAGNVYSLIMYCTIASPTALSDTNTSLKKYFIDSWPLGLPSKDEITLAMCHMDVYKDLVYLHTLQKFKDVRIKHIGLEPSHPLVDSEERFKMANFMVNNGLKILGKTLPNLPEDIQLVLATEANLIGDTQGLSTSNLLKRVYRPMGFKLSKNKTKRRKGICYGKIDDVLGRTKTIKDDEKAPDDSDQEGSDDSLFSSATRQSKPYVEWSDDSPLLPAAEQPKSDVEESDDSPLLPATEQAKPGVEGSGDTPLLPATEQAKPGVEGSDDTPLSPATKPLGRVMRLGAGLGGGGFGDGRLGGGGFGDGGLGGGGLGGGGLGGGRLGRGGSGGGGSGIGVS